MKTCVVCLRRVFEASCVCVEPTAAEEAVLVKAGVEDMASLVYCKSCWAILGDPKAAPQLMRSTAERLMLRYGVPPVRAKAAADKLYMRLVEAQRRRQHGSLV